MRESAAGALDASLAIASNRLNQTMKGLAVITVAVAVVGSVFGAYGMNFAWLPLAFGTLGVLGVSLLRTIALVAAAPLGWRLVVVLSAPPPREIETLPLGEDGGSVVRLLPHSLRPLGVASPPPLFQAEAGAPSHEDLDRGRRRRLEAAAAELPAEVGLRGGRRPRTGPRRGTCGKGASS